MFEGSTLIPDQQDFEYPSDNIYIEILNEDFPLIKQLTQKPKLSLLDLGTGEGNVSVAMSKNVLLLWQVWPLPTQLYNTLHQI